MKIKFAIIGLFITLAFLIAGFMNLVLKKQVGHYSQTASLPYVATSTVVYNPDPLLFSSAISMFPKDEAKVQKGDRGGIIPHHDLASRLIAEFFQKLPTPKTVILVGTNHPNAGNGLAITGNILWQTPVGNVETDTKIMGELVRDKLVSLDNSPFLTEHSIYVEIPFIKHYFPNAKVVPIILNSHHDLQKSLKLGDALSKYLQNKDVILVGSLDFSHYLPTEITREKDKVTRAAIMSYDFQTISKFNNDNADSPPTLITVMRAMQDLKTNMRIIQNKDLSDMMGQSSVKSSTSYFTLMFY